MKSINIISNYTSYIEKSLKKTAKIILDKKYEEEVFSKLLKTYIDVRYFDSQKRKSKSPYSNTKMYISQEMAKLKSNGVSKDILKIYEEVLSSDQNNQNINTFLNNIKEYRAKLGIDNKNIDNEITQVFEEKKAKMQEIKKAFSSKDFKCIYKNTNINKVYIVSLDYSFSIPKLYSDFAIDKVYTKGVIAEDKLYVEYYQVVYKILNDIINYDFSNNYIIEFTSSILEKETKRDGLLNILSNDICKEKMILKITYSDYKEYKDIIVDYINNGYNFAIIIDDNFNNSQEEKKVITSIFKYIIIKSKSKNIDSFNECSNLIKIK